nr:flagellar biosynthetic protein FliR [Roseovarius sp. MMSF_3281]
MTQMAEAIDLSRGLLWLHLAVLLRVGPAIALFPGFGEQALPVRIKLVIALMVTVVMAPAVAPFVPSSQVAPGNVVWLALSESAVGLLIGLGIRLFVMALQTAGSIAGQSTSLSHILGSVGVTPLPAIGHFLVIGGIALVMILGLHVRAIQMLVLTYGIFPVGVFPEAASVGQWGMRQVAGAFALAFTLAAPFVIVSVLYNLTLGIINRAMPQLMVVFVGAPVITGLGLLFLFLLAPTILTIWANALDRFLANPLGGG